MSSPLFAAQGPRDNVPYIPEYDGIHRDWINIAEIPEEWKKTSIKELCHQSNPRHPHYEPEDSSKKALFYIRQMVRYHDCWNVINALQKKFPEKIQVTVDHEFAQQHPNAFLYGSQKRTSYMDIQVLVARIKRIDAELGIKRTNPGELDE